MYAQRILEQTRITLAKDHGPGAITPPDNADPYHNIVDTSQGLQSKISTIKSVKPKCEARGGFVYLDKGMLKAMLRIASPYSYTVTEISGGCHSLTSSHYLGYAFDVGKINGTIVSGNNGADWSGFSTQCTLNGATQVLNPGNDRNHQ